MCYVLCVGMILQYLVMCSTALWGIPPAGPTVELNYFSTSYRPRHHHTHRCSCMQIDGCTTVLVAYDIKWDFLLSKVSDLLRVAYWAIRAYDDPNPGNQTDFYLSAAPQTFRELWHFPREHHIQSTYSKVSYILVLLIYMYSLSTYRHDCTPRFSSTISLHCYCQIRMAAL